MISLTLEDRRALSVLSITIVLALYLIFLTWRSSPFIDVWPLVVSEALSRGLPVVTYRLHNIEYAYGWCPAVKLIRVGAVEEVVEEILKLLQDDTRLLSMSNTALEFVKNVLEKDGIIRN